ncbi:hypothetical protein GDO78_021320 [Eleutherodactylus coqui]|uniref:Uncharacterized protein n=1 Tax=Eleutherodactylus coqui TaxID=57060 RepID=A0A8J6BDM9_ELECQ|nr:hypothetical protein GDO78_021320 [Eleutherodactylus coqui]
MSCSLDWCADALSRLLQDADSSVLTAVARIGITKFLFTSVHAIPRMATAVTAELFASCRIALALQIADL